MGTPRIRTQILRQNVREKLPDAGLGHMPNPPKLYMEVRYLTIVVVCHIELGFGLANWATVAHFNFWDHFWPFLAIFQMAIGPIIF